MHANAVREPWKQDKPAIGSLLTLNSPLMAEVMGHVGFDWLGVDLQHSETNLAQIEGMFQAVSSTPAMPFTRVGGNDSISIQRVLDLSAYGIIVPYVQTVEEAEAAVRAAKYPPRGPSSPRPAPASPDAQKLPVEPERGRRAVAAGRSPRGQECK